jgi:hypothetical protein
MLNDECWMLAPMARFKVQGLKFKVFGSTLKTSPVESVIINAPNPTL